jgi:hypothetical protein
MLQYSHLAFDPLIRWKKDNSFEAGWPRRGSASTP